MRLNQIENTQALAVGPHITFLPLPEATDSFLLLANTDFAYTVPQNVKFIVLHCEDDFYMRNGAVAAIPIGTVIDGTASQQNPHGILVEGLEILHFIAPRESIMTLSRFEK